jgi:ABC-type bacteriocin/lantibiotic exporter with double-glycine peptidase domain
MQIRTQETGPLGKLLTVIVGAILLVLGFMFSIVLLAVVVVVGLGVWGWFWWKTRKLRQQINERMREQEQTRPFSTDGDIIEGEAVIVEEETTRVTSNRLPASPDHRSPD